jgi:hypothetical protein
VDPRRSLIHRVVGQWLNEGSTPALRVPDPAVKRIYVPGEYPRQRPAHGDRADEDTAVESVRDHARYASTGPSASRAKRGPEPSRSVPRDRPPDGAAGRLISRASLSDGGRRQCDAVEDPESHDHSATVGRPTTSSGAGEIVPQRARLPTRAIPTRVGEGVSQATG